MIGWDKNRIKEKVTHSSDKYGFGNPQQFEQLKKRLSECDPQEVYEGLIGVFKEDRGDSSNSQELAGRLLYDVRPRAVFDLYEEIKSCLPFFDVSVEHMPFYFAERCGLKEVVSVVSRLQGALLSEREEESLSTIKFWLDNYKSWKAQQRGTGSGPRFEHS